MGEGSGLGVLVGKGVFVGGTAVGDGGILVGVGGIGVLVGDGKGVEVGWGCAGCPHAFTKNKRATRSEIIRNLFGKLVTMTFSPFAVQERKLEKTETDRK